MVTPLSRAGSFRTPTTNSLTSVTPSPAPRETAGDSSTQPISSVTRAMNSLLSDADAMGDSSVMQSSNTGQVQLPGGSAVNERLSLETLILTAVSGHPSVEAKRAELKAATASTASARWQYFPTPSVSSRQKSKGDVSSYAIQQPIWTAGRLDAGLDAALSRTRSATSSIAEAQYQIALSVISAWQSWLTAHKRVRVLEKGDAVLFAYLERVKLRIRSGLSAEVDRQLVDSRILQSRSDLATARATERSALMQLSQLTGRTLQGEQLNPVIRGMVGEPPNFDNLLAKAYAYSPSLKRLESELEALGYDSVQKKTTAWPTVALRAEQVKNAFVGDSVVPSETTNYLVVLDYVPGAGLSSQSEAEAIAAKVGGLKESNESTRRDLTSKVKSDFEDFVATRSRFQVSKETVAASAGVLASYDRLFMAGKRGWLEVLNAARELTQVEASFVEVEVGYSASYQRLRLHMGEFAWQQQVEGKS